MNGTHTRLPTHSPLSPQTYTHTHTHAGASRGFLLKSSSFHQKKSLEEHLRILPTSKYTFSALAMASLSSELSRCRSPLHPTSHSESVCGDGILQLKYSVFLPPRRTSLRAQPRMGNVNDGKGVFAPLVVVTRNIVGKQRFNQLRGKAIALHSQVITEFCKSIGADAKQRQGLIRLAKKNGEKLGFLA